jgi:predicted adenylyl cyclase CyaB
MKTINEVEAKIALSEKEFTYLVDKFKPVSSFPQSNSFFKLEDNIIRVRNEKNKTIVCLKGPRIEGHYNSRLETEFYFEGNEFFAALKIKPFFSYEKRRTEVKYNGCTLSLDDLGEGRKYLEVEGDKKNIEAVLINLGMQNKPIERRSYLEILGGIKWAA